MGEGTCRRYPHSGTAGPVHAGTPSPIPGRLRIVWRQNGDVKKVEPLGVKIVCISVITSSLKCPGGGIPITTLVMRTHH